MIFVLFSVCFILIAVLIGVNLARRLSNPINNLIIHLINKGNVEIFDFMLNNEQNAATIYIDFLDKYPLSIYYDDIRLRLRELTN